MELERTGPKVPFVVHHCCCQVVATGGLTSEGIFRISIASDDVELYSKNFDRGDYSLPAKDPNYAAVLLKHYLRSLPEPLCPDYETCLAAAKSDDLLAKMFASLPEVNRNVLRYLANFVCLLGDAKYVAKTKMEVPALCIVFTPATLKNPVFDYASAIRNQPLEQDFMLRLVLWIRSRFPDDSVAGFAPAETSAANKKSLRPQRRAPPAPVAAAAASTPPPPLLKKRASTLEECVTPSGGNASPGKSRKTGKSVSPNNSQRSALSPTNV